MKRLLGKSGTATRTYASKAAFNTLTGSPLLSNTLVTIPGNTNGIDIISATLSCGADPTATAYISDQAGVGFIAIARDSQAFSLGSPVTIPPGRVLNVTTMGQCDVVINYTVL